MKLLVIDPHVHSGKPTMRSWMVAFPDFRGLFDGVEVWATECGVPQDLGVNFRFFKQHFPFWSLHALDFQRRVTRLLRRNPPGRDTLVMTTGCNVPVADIRYIHYWHRAVLEEREKRPGHFKLSLHQRFVSEYVARCERSVVANQNSTAFWWVVGRGLGDKIQQEGAGGEFRILPNTFDPTRFHHGVIDQWQIPMRQFYNIAGDEIILAFSSFGHFERKGLLQAVEAVYLLRKRGKKVRLLVLGGNSPTIDRFKQLMARRNLERGMVIFAGSVDQVEQHLAAADAFIFPSHFEAFSLAEIEAAALGLRLYLTPHYGSEMILVEPENGRMLPWDPPGMADVIAGDLEANQGLARHSQLGSAMTPKEFSGKIQQLFSEAILKKKTVAEQ